MRGSVIIVSYFILGTLCALAGVIPSWVTDGNISFYALCALMFCVGMSIGSDASGLKKFKSLDRRMLMLPFLTIAGTLCGSALMSVFVPGRSVTECLAIGSGMGYYSLSSIFITEYMGAEPGIVALLSNIMREIITLLAAPFIAVYFGKLAPISCGGATSMDTTLPIISTVSGPELVIVSVYHGIIADFSVPFLVTLFCSL